MLYPSVWPLSHQRSCCVDIAFEVITVDSDYFRGKVEQYTRLNPDGESRKLKNQVHAQSTCVCRLHPCSEPALKPALPQFDAEHRPALMALLRESLIGACTDGTRFSDGDPAITWLYMNEGECTINRFVPA